MFLLPSSRQASRHAAAVRLQRQTASLLLPDTSRSCKRSPCPPSLLCSLLLLLLLPESPPSKPARYCVAAHLQVRLAVLLHGLQHALQEGLLHAWRPRGAQPLHSQPSVTSCGKQLTAASQQTVQDVLCHEGWQHVQGTRGACSTEHNHSRRGVPHLQQEGHRGPLHDNGQKGLQQAPPRSHACLLRLSQRACTAAGQL